PPGVEPRARRQHGRGREGLSRAAGAAAQRRGVAELPGLHVGGPGRPARKGPRAPREGGGAGASQRGLPRLARLGLFPHGQARLGREEPARGGAPGAFRSYDLRAPRRPRHEAGSTRRRGPALGEGARAEVGRRRPSPREAAARTGTRLEALSRRGLLRLASPLFCLTLAACAPRRGTRHFSPATDAASRDALDAWGAIRERAAGLSSSRLLYDAKMGRGSVAAVPGS